MDTTESSDSVAVDSGDASECWKDVFADDVILTVNATPTTSVASAEASGLLAANSDLLSEVGSGELLTVIEEATDDDDDDDENADDNYEFGPDASGNSDGGGGNENDEENTDCEGNVGEGLAHSSGGAARGAEGGIDVVHSAYLIAA